MEQYTLEKREETVLQKYLADETVGQIVFVRHLGNWDAAILSFGKEGGAWKPFLFTKGCIGEDGVGEASVDLCRTPEGDFGIVTAFGIKEDPGTSLPYLHITDDDYCCGDPGECYNRMIRLSEHPHVCAGEHLIECDPEYDYGFFFDYNKEQVYEKGFAFFFHCTGDVPYTGGCVAVSETDMAALLRFLEPGARLIIEALEG